MNKWDVISNLFLSMILSPCCLRGLDVSMTEVHPRIWDADMVVNPLNSSMKIYSSASVVELMNSVINVDAMILVSKIPFQLMPTIFIDSKLMVDMLKTLFHASLTFSDFVDFTREGVLHSIADEVNLLAAFSVEKNS